MTIYAEFGYAGAGKDELFRQAQLLAPDAVARVALGDELKHQADGACLANFGISAFTSDPDEKEYIRPLLERIGREHGLSLLPAVITRALDLEQEGKVVFATRVQNATEMAEWLSVGAVPVWVVRHCNMAATHQEALDVAGILSMHLELVMCDAGDLRGVQANAWRLLERAGVKL